MQQIEDALFSEDGIDPASGLHYTELLDFDTFVNKYLMAEVLDDYDGQFSYFYKDSDAIDPKVYVGPVWDQDNILGVWLPQSDPSTIHLSDESPEFFRWPFPISQDMVRFNTATGDSFEKQIAYLKEYLSARLEALDAFFLSVN